MIFHIVSPILQRRNRVYFIEYFDHIWWMVLYFLGNGNASGIPAAPPKNPPKRSESGFERCARGERFSPVGALPRQSDVCVPVLWGSALLGSDDRARGTRTLTVPKVALQRSLVFL